MAWAVLAPMPLTLANPAASARFKSAFAAKAVLDPARPPGDRGGAGAFGMADGARDRGGSGSMKPFAESSCRSPAAESLPEIPFWEASGPEEAAGTPFRAVESVADRNPGGSAAPAIPGADGTFADGKAETKADKKKMKHDKKRLAADKDTLDDSRAELRHDQKNGAGPAETTQDRAAVGKDKMDVAAGERAVHDDKAEIEADKRSVDASKAELKKDKKAKAKHKDKVDDAKDHAKAEIDEVPAH
jgi:hypothetical protein